MSSGLVSSPRDIPWPTLSQLNVTGEPERRRQLRWHREKGINSEDDGESIRLRGKLDAELIELTWLELKAEADLDNAHESLRNAGALTSLAKDSPAFRQYLNAYLYFGIRFAVGRAPSQGLQTQSQWNERPAGLPTPPKFEGIELEEVHLAVTRFFDIPTTVQEQKAQTFLDGFTVGTDELPLVEGEALFDPQASESTRFELWLRGLYPDPEYGPLFRELADGLFSWAGKRHDFYVSLEKRQGRERTVERWENAQIGVEGRWIARNPLSARCGLVDLYWLAQILRAGVSPRGVVTYKRRSWLYYLPSLDPDRYPRDRVLRVEEVLRSVFDFTCELIQNAVEIAERRENRKVDPPPKQRRSEDWRPAYDREIGEIANQRRERLFKDDSKLTCAAQEGGEGSEPPPDDYWSRRIRSGEHEGNLVGLALSGGGIRSATFGLGVLQSLRDFDLLRQIDYLSTVSGGGYVGAWLLGNVRRTHYWLSRMTSWDESISHLRRYSKYLAPQTGVLSADSWVIWGTWLRNVILIQLTAISWLASLFVAAIGLKVVFDGISGNAGGVLLLAVIGGLAAIVFINLWYPALHKKTQHRTAVLLAWVGSFVAAALLWHEAISHPKVQDYSKILISELAGWPTAVPVVLAFCLYLLAVCSVWRTKILVSPQGALERFTGGAAIAIVSSGVCYLGTSAVVYWFQRWASWGRPHYGWYAYVLGPSMVLLAVALAVVIFVGLVGRDSADWRREWWTRYGSWMAIFGGAFFAAVVAAIFGPVWFVRFYRRYLGHPTVHWGAVAAWVGSTISGLLAGNSNKTKGNGAGPSKILEWVARAGGFVFIVGAILAVATLVQVLISEVWLDVPSTWWINLNDLLEDSCAIPMLGTYGPLLVTLAVLLTCGLMFSWRFNINTFGLNQFYRNRLVRCYLGATRWIPGLRRPEAFTGFDDADDCDLTELQYQTQVDGEHFRGPFPIVNCSLNLGGSGDLSVHTRQSASFVLTPLHAGSDRPKVGYAPVKKEKGFGDGVTLGQAISVSGAAASPNMGYNTSPLVSILLTMFNVRLAWWFPNPGRKKWNQDSPILSLGYLILEFLGLADETSNFVNVSDGGHFENLGIYELVRRRTKVIIASDAECDSAMAFGSLGNVIRICETDFGAKIDIDVSSIRKQPSTGLSRGHCAVGRIAYSNGSLGYLIYLKSSITGDEDADIQQYRANHPDFPHQSTGDQFFTEDQFESYRRLGQHIARVALRAGLDERNVVAMAGKLFEVWAPAGCSSGSFLTHTKTLDNLWEVLRKSPQLKDLLQELLANTPNPPGPGVLKPQEATICLELIQLMEDVFMDLRLEEFWEHPDNRGWAILFTTWAKSPKLRATWNRNRSSYGIRFEYFCGERLGLPVSRPVQTV